MKMHKSLFFIVVVLVSLASFSQSIKGNIKDSKTNEPIEGASVYFDNTTIGDISNMEGDFEIPFNESINTSLVISFLGYKKQVVAEYDPSKSINIKLIEDVSTLNEVVIDSRDTWSRKKKLEQFKMQFLGFSDNSLSCKILNEEDIYLRYLENENMLVASTKKPIRIRNKNLGYNIEYDLQEFEIQYEISSGSLKINTVSSVFYSGTTYYKSDKVSNKILKKRRNTYYGSSLHFMRSLLYDKLEENKFSLLYEKNEISAENFISKYATNESSIYQVRIFKPLVIVYDKNVARQSSITPNQDYFYLDLNGGYSPIEAITFTGEMGTKRFGDTLPLDYKPDK